MLIYLLPLFSSRRGRIAAVCTLGVGMLGGIMPRNAFAQGFSIFGISQGNTARIDRIDFDSPSDNALTYTTIFTTGTNGSAVVNNANGLALDSANARLYYRGGSDNNLGSGNGLFYRYDIASGQQVQLTQSGTISATNPALNTLVFASASFYNGAYYTVGTGGDSLFRVNFVPNTTNFTITPLLTNTNGGAEENLTFGDIAITTGGFGDTSNTGADTDGVLFGFGQTGAGTAGAANQFFRGRIPATAGTTLTGFANTNKGAPNTTTNALIQLGFGRDSDSTGGNVNGVRQNLFGHNRDNGSWSRVNTTNGDQTVFFTDAARTYNDITSATLQPVPAPPAVVSLAIGGLVGLVATGARKNRLRRRREQTTNAA